MSYQLHVKQPWHDPLDTLIALEGASHYAMLYSGSAEQNTGRYSFLAWQPAYVHALARFDDFPACDDTCEKNLPQWIGYVGYAMRHAAESGLAKGEKPPIPMPDAVFTQYKQLLRFDHAAGTIEHFILKGSTPEALHFSHGAIAADTKAAPMELLSNMSRDDYLRIVNATKEQIADGNFYQANITRKFYGSYENPIQPRQVFQSLCAISPSPYSALIVMGDRAVVSSSPEGFLSVDDEGTISARPIKGSAPREVDAKADTAILNALIASEKNHAENLMIVDLMRNDLARVCESGSVHVSDLARAYSYTTIHHLISTIHGKLTPEATHGDMFKATFPPGSMTGAPKIAAMNWCAEQEVAERGIYSGVIGWLGAGRACDFSVVIRTIIVSGNQFEFQVGGGIVADSSAEEEWRETLAKARAVAGALGIDMATLEAL